MTIMRITVLPVLILFTLLVNAAEHAVILQYHHISNTTPAITSTRPELFKWQMDYLKNNNYQVLPLSQVVDAIQRHQPLPPKSVVITFDDSYRSIYKTAFPILKANNWPFALFIDTDGVGRNKKHLTWDEVREMKAHGAEILNHSHSHTHFVRQKTGETEAQWLGRIENEINKAQALIVKETGPTSKILAYPYGEYSLEIINLVESMGYTGVGQHSGPLGYDMPMSLIPRYPMGAFFGKKPSFIQKLNTLPLPLQSYPKLEPIQLRETQPTLSLNFDLPSSKAKSLSQKLKRQFQCYVGGDKAELSWIERNSVVSQVNIKAKKAIPVARSRYNCTLPVSTLNPEKLKRTDIDHRTYYWYSQVWIRPKKNGQWYKE